MCSHDFSMRARSLSLERRRGLVVLHCRDTVGLACWHFLNEVLVARVGRLAARLPGANADDSSARNSRTERYFAV